MPDEHRLTIEISNEQPVLLEDFTHGFSAVADEYQDYVQRRGTAPPPDAQLYVREIRTGSIIVDLIARHGPEIAITAIPFMEHASSVIEFAGYLKRCYEYLTGGRSDKPDDLTPKNYLDLSQIVEPVAKDSASQINISGTVNGNVVVNIGMDSVMANAAQNAARREIDNLGIPDKRIHEKVALYLYQGRNDPKSTSGDRGIIESISPSHVRLVFVNEMVKGQVFRIPENPFKSVFVVDVAVETVKGRPVLFNVLAIHDVFDKPSDPSPQSPPSKRRPPSKQRKRRR